MEAFYSSGQLFANTDRNDKIETTLNNTPFNKFRDLNLGKLLPAPVDFLYNNDLYNHKYGKLRDYKQKGVVSAPYGVSYTIRPPNEYINGRYSQLLDKNLNREVDLSGQIFRNKDLRLPAPKIISS